MNFLLEFSRDQFTKKNLPISDVVSSGGMVVLTGMLTVFSVLILLWFTLFVFKFFFHDLARAKKTKAVKSELPDPVINAPVVSENDEIIAVIAAAIAMAESECGSDKKFHVVSFKRK